MRTLALLAMVMTSGAAQAAMQRPEVPLLDDYQIRADMKDGEEIETRVDGDMNGDGDGDTAYIIASDDDRVVHVWFAARGEFDLYHEPAGSFHLQTYPLGPAEMTVTKGVLVIKDLVGGTTATATTYRFRGEKTKPKMRLIGLDTGVYSRTFSHDGSEMSWNVLTGDVIATKLKLTGAADDTAYDKRDTRRFKRPVTTYYMEETPDIDEALGMAIEGK